MGEKTKFFGMLALSFSLLCLASAIGYFGYELNGWRKQLPEILGLVTDTSGQIAPAMENITEVEKLIPPILDEVEAVRKTVDNLVAEVENTRKALPGILADLEPITRQVENTAKQLPALIDPLVEEVGKTRETIPGILDQVQATNSEVAKVRELVPGILEEVRLTREELPDLMDRADQLVANAGEAGKEAGKGAMTGMIGGIVAMPFGLVGGIGKGLTGLAGGEEIETLTTEDQELMRKKLLDLAENGKEGEVATWKNRKTANSGKITLLRKYVENDQECREVKVELFIDGQEPQLHTVSGCRQPDGSWVATQ